MKILCPNCGEIKQYGQIERVRRVLLFGENNEPCGVTEDVEEYVGKPRCLKCNSMVAFYEDTERGK